MSNATDPKKASFEQLASLAGFIVDFLATILSFDNVNYWLGHKTELKKKLREVFSVIDEYIDVKIDWQKFCKGQFGMDVDFSAVTIPAKPNGENWRLLFVAKGLTLNRVFEQWSFKKWRYNDDLDKAVPTNKRIADKHYAVWVRDGVEPDAEYLGKSTRQADPNMEIGMTLLERMILESKYFAETGKHLDIEGATFCTGSLCVDGRVPEVCWFSLDLYVRVGLYDLNYSSSGYGLRSAVS